MRLIRVWSCTVVAAIAMTASASAVELTPPQVGTRGERYCELLLLKPRGARLTATVWTTYSLNGCPLQAWWSLDTALVSWRTGSLAVRNGPRFWTIDAIESEAGVARPVRTFDTLQMRFGATITNLTPGQFGPYRAQRVTRRTVFTWNAGETVCELTSPTGRRFVMQSYSQQRVRTLSEADLAGLGTRLRLPAGWRYTTRVLAEDLRIDTTAVPAEVLPDDLGNSYTYVPGT